MNLKDAIYPLLAAVCYSTNPILAKLGLRISNEPLLGACIGMLASAVVYSVYFFWQRTGPAAVRHAPCGWLVFWFGRPGYDHRYL